MMLCPKCSSTSVAEIMYGLPDFSSEELKKAYADGKIRFGGCVVFEGEKQPTHHCVSCEYEWFVE